MRYTRVIIIFLFLMSIMSACKKTSNNDDLIEVNMQLNGESEHWKATCNAKGYVQFHDKNDKLTMDSDGDYVLIVEYKGALNEISTMRTLKVERLSSCCTRTFDIPDSLTYKNEGHLNAVEIVELSKENNIEIKVTWDGSNGDTEIITVK